MTALEQSPHLDFPRAVIHHAMLGSHDLVAVECGGIKGNLLHLGDASDGVGLTRACGLVLVQPVEEELLEQGGLAPCWHYLHLHTSETITSAGVNINSETKKG